MKENNKPAESRSWKILSLVLVLFLGGALIYSYNLSAQNTQYKINLQNSYQRAFHDMVKSVENINVLLTKAQVTNSTVQSTELMSRIWRQSNSAGENLSQLPLQHNALTKTQKYLTQVGDYCYVLSRQNAANKLPTDQQINQIAKFQTYAENLLNELRAMQQDVSNGSIQFGASSDLSNRVMGKVQANMADNSFGRIEKHFTEYPTLIYDGPYSDQVAQGDPKGLVGPNINVDKAKDIAKKFIQKDQDGKQSSASIGKIIEASSGKGSIPTFGLEIIPKSNDRSKSIQMDITKKGGYVVWMLNPRKVTEKKLTDQQASDKAKAFLKGQGFGDLEETYFLKNDNTTTITFAALEKNKVLVYPDQLKVKVALDNGEVVGFDAHTYIMSHRKRDILKPLITEAQAKEKVSKRVKVNRTRLAVIPLPAEKEQLCYEFRGTYSNSDYFIYINAANGNEESILKIIKEPNGTLTQ